MSTQLKALVIGTAQGEARYHPLEPVAPLLGDILARAGFAEVVTTTDLDALRHERLREFDLCVSYLDMWEQQLDAAQVAGILQCTASGQGFLAIHSGISCENMAYRHLVGARFVEHPPYQAFAVQISDRGHPITQGLADFTIEDELYICEFVQPNDLHFLAMGIIGEQRHPIAWVRPFGLGRVAYLALGHSAPSFQNDGFAQMVASAARWCSRAQ